MKILIINGNSDDRKKEIDRAAEDLVEKIRRAGHTAEMIILREKKIKDCIGCFGCWVKTPGLCVHKDDMADILKKIIGSEKQIFVSDVRFGMLSPTLLTAYNRFLPMGCAYLTMDNRKKTMHYPRYERKWSPGLLIENFPGKNEESLKNLSYCLNRNNEENYLGTWIIGENEEEAGDAVNGN